MREYKSEAIRNIAVVGHGASGKTTLVDALAFVSGTSKRHGTVKDGTTLTDTSPEEIDRKYSISLGCAFAEWKDTKINLIDTPGFLDFQGDAIAGIAAADGVLVAIGAGTLKHVELELRKHGRRVAASADDAAVPGSTNRLTATRSTVARSANNKLTIQAARSANNQLTEKMASFSSRATT